MKANTSNLITSYFAFILIAAVLFCNDSFAQSPGHKLSPVFAEKIFSLKKNVPLKLRVLLKGTGVPPQLQHFSPEKIEGYDLGAFYYLQATIDELNKIILPSPYVLFVDDGTRIPKEEVQVNNLDLSTNRINVVHTKHPQWNGNRGDFFQEQLLIMVSSVFL